MFFCQSPSFQSVVFVYTISLSFDGGEYDTVKPVRALLQRCGGTLREPMIRILCDARSFSSYIQLLFVM